MRIAGIVPLPIKTMGGVFMLTPEQACHKARESAVRHARREEIPFVFFLTGWYTEHINTQEASHAGQAQPETLHCLD